MISDAIISEDGLYRYVLNRRWDPDLPVEPWICLNPSTADDDADDPSVRRMMSFARREGCGGICVLNLYAVRSPSPHVLRYHGRFHPDLADPVGPDNDKWLAGLGELAELAYHLDGEETVPAVAAWGSHPAAAARAPHVLKLLRGLPLVCLGVTASGAPRHPLYVRRDTPLIPYPASLCPGGCGCRTGTDDAGRRECGCDGGCCDE